MISVDSNGWNERLTHGAKAAQYNRIIDKADPSEIVTSVVVPCEVYKRIRMLKDEETALEAVAALSQTKVVPIDQTLSLEAAEYSLEHGLHFADALVYATARQSSAELHTSAEDLRGFPGVSFL